MRLCHVVTEDSQTDLPIYIDSVQPLVQAVLDLEGEPADELSVRFVTADEISKIHAEYFDDPTVTDCISFPMDDGDQKYRCLGDVVVCPKVAIDYGKGHGIDAYHECSLYLFHGILHLLGYNDIEQEGRTVMRAAEERHMKNLIKKDLVLKPTHVD